MSHSSLLRVGSLFVAAAVLSGCGGGGGGGGSVTPPPVAPPPAVTPGPVVAPAPGIDGPAWWGFARDARHTAVSEIASQDLGRIAWSAPVDEAPQYTEDGALLTHYGSPLVTARNTLILPVKTGAAGGFRIEARSGGNGGLLWSAATDYLLPPHNWIPSYNLQLTTAGRLYAPGAGGKLLVRGSAESTTASFQASLFYGAAAYNADPAAFHATVFISTPLVADAQGNVFFGFVVTGANPAGLASGVARVGADGQGRWVSASAAAADDGTPKPATNSAPALSPDGGTLYVAVNADAVPNTVQRGYLLALDSNTLQTRARVALLDPVTGTPARVSDNGTSSPAVGPDGRVFFGVLESVFGAHNGRGWLLQFDALLAPAGVPGSFGWDVTPTVIPAGMVPSYFGPSTYLLALKYNNYLRAGSSSGDGMNRLAVIDPQASQQDAYSTTTVMREVLTLLSPTPEPGSSGREEWCINTMAADPLRRSILVNNEDGVLYRWDLASNSLSQSVRLTSGLGQAYTPTLVGADGAVYAIANARLFSIRAN
jgi:hypothetical protein